MGPQAPLVWVNSWRPPGWAEGQDTETPSGGPDPHSQQAEPGVGILGPPEETVDLFVGWLSQGVKTSAPQMGVGVLKATRLR